MARASSSPISASLLAAIEATLAISLLFLILIDILVSLSADVGNGGFDSLLHLDRIDTGGNGFETFVENRFGHDGRGGGSVAGDVAGFAGDFANHLGTHVFVGVFQFDFLGDANAVFGDGRRAEALLQESRCGLWDRV